MSTIKAGDLVMVVRPTMCGSTDGIGEAFTVTCVSYARAKCGCGEYVEGMMAQGIRKDPGPFGPWVVEIRRLIKIDPPALDETTEQEKELTI